MSDSLKYHCNNCGHVWNGDEFTLDCESCSSADIEIAKASTQKIKKGDIPEDRTLKPEDFQQKGQDDSGTIVVPRNTENQEKVEPTEFKSGQSVPPETLRPAAKETSGPPPPPEPRPEKTSAPKQNIHKESVKPEENVASTASANNTHASSTPPAEKKSGGNKSLILIILLLLLGGAGGAYFFWQDSQEDPNGDNNIQNQNETPENLEFVEVKLSVSERDQEYFLSGSIIESNSESSLILTEISRLFRVSDDREFKFDENTGQVYFCEEMIGPTVFGIELKDRKVDETDCDAIDLDLFGKAASAEANCVYRLEDDKIALSFTKDCNMIVKINDNHKFKSIRVSVSGPQGPFKDKFKWDVSSSSNQEVDVWVQQDDLKPIAYRQNGNQTVPLCLAKAPAQDQAKGGLDLQKIIEEITVAATSFGLNPRDRASAVKLQQLSMSLAKQPVFVIDGESISGFSAGTNKMKTDFRNDSKTYVLMGAPEIIDNQYFKIKYQSK